MHLTGAVIVAVSLLVACAGRAGVDVESRSSTPESLQPTSTVPPGTEPRSTTTVTGQPPSSTPPPVTTDVVVFDLAEFDIEVSLRETVAPTPPGGYDGFHTVVAVEGSLLASGFDAAGDGIQPERSALWRSTNGIEWERIGVRDVSARPDQQTINSLIVADGSVRGYGTLLDTSTRTIRSEGIGRWHSGDGGDTWSDVSSAGAGTARRAVLVDDTVVTVGSGGANGLGAFYGLVTLEGSDGAVRQHPVDVDAAGDPLPGGDVHDLLVGPHEWLAVGATTRSDLGADGDESVFDAEVLGFPSDVAVWSSTDAGESWEPLEVVRFEGESGTQVALQIVDDGNRSWMLVNAQKFGVFALDLYTSTDSRTWELHPYRRPVEPTANQFANARGIYFVEGAIVVIDEVVEGSEPSLVMSVIDPSTDEVVSHDLTLELGGVSQVEDIIQLDELALGVGRIERGAAASDLQTIEIRRIEPDGQPEPVPSSTTPDGGGGTSA